ncbi:MAG: sulfatase-like hydrolase/transferase [Bacteroidota bacterium]
MNRLYMSLKKFLFLAVSISIVSSSLQAQYLENEIQGNNKVNVILLMADDLGWGDVGFNGNEKIITPHLDNMAKSGLRFTNFYAAAPLCSPTRASVLTGRSPFRQGIFAAHTGGMRMGEKTIAEELKKAGYSTGFFGKWHLGWVQPEAISSRGYYSPPWHHGYDEVFATRSAVPTYNPTEVPKGWKKFGIGKDGNWDGSVYVHNGEEVKENLEGDDSRIIMDRVLPFLEQAVKDESPFFATIWFHTPHEPVVAGPEYLAKYPDLKESQKHLYGAITAMDDQIGRLKSFLKENNLEDNTIIFFTSDNGPSGPLVRREIASAGPFRGHKHQMWEGGLRVPSLVEWPGTITAGKVTDFQASTVDYYPTIIDLVGLKMDEDIPYDGVSMLPFLKGDQVKRNVPVASGYQRLYKDTDLYALIQGKYKICIPEEGKEMMLFDLEEDPTESKNIANENPKLFEQMKQELEKVKASWLLSREGSDYEW